MKKLFVKVVIILLVVFGFKVVVIEPDKPHTFEVTIPSFTDIVEFFDKVSDATEEVTREFEVVPVDDNENVEEELLKEAFFECRNDVEYVYTENLRKDNMIRRKINFLHHSDVSFSQKEIAFFSYRHIDIVACNAVVECVKKIPNVAIWIDEQLSAGEYYDEEIQEALRLSDSMLQVVTPHYFMEGSYTMERELPLARQMNLPIIAVVCETISEELTSYLQEQVDYVCSLQDFDSIRTIFDELHNQRKKADIIQAFLQLTKRIDTWYLTAEDMYRLACGYYHLIESGNTSLIPKMLTIEKATQYARCAAIAGVSGAETILHQLGERK